MNRKRNRGQDAVLKAIRSHCLQMGMTFDADARVETAEESLLRSTAHWPSIREELERGGGSELKSRGGKRPKFHSLHSSAALCVDAFAPFKEQPEAIRFLGYVPFLVARFEMKLKTGISRPNLDFYLEDKDHVIGIESKYTEWLSPKVPDHGANLTMYLHRADELLVVHDGLIQELIAYYVSEQEKLFLDVAQLIKHALGLFACAAQNDTVPVLVYVYWVPRNAPDLVEHRRHLSVIAEFGQRISPFLSFRALSYTELWEVLENDSHYRDTLPLLRKRYEIDVN